eukprot:11207862-Lingulodinium_polyedra.AAC.1
MAAPRARGREGRRSHAGRGLLNRSERGASCNGAREQQFNQTAADNTGIPICAPNAEALGRAPARRRLCMSAQM